MPTLLRLLIGVAVTVGLYWLAAQDQMQGSLLTIAWLADSATFFMPFVILAQLAGIALTAPPAIRAAALATAAAASTFALLHPQVTSASADPTHPLRVMTLNVLAENQNYDGVRRYIREVKADIVVLQEVNHLWSQNVLTWTEFAVRVTSLSSDIAVLSKYPLSTPAAAAVRNLSPIVTRIALKVGSPQTQVVLYGIHPASPRSVEKWIARNKTLKSTAEAIELEGDGQPVIVAGDWNTPPWSPHLLRFLDSTRLSAAHEGLWPPPTRLSLRPYVPKFLGAPIDRIVVSHDVSVVHQFVGHDVGSDHRPVIADLRLVRSDK